MISYCFQRRLSQVTIESLGITWICVLEDFTHVGCEGHKVSFCLRRLDLQFISCKHGRASRWRCVRVSVQSATRRGILTVFDVRLTRFLAAFGGSQGQVGVGSVGRTRGYDHTSYVAHVKIETAPGGLATNQIAGAESPVMHWHWSATQKRCSFCSV